jgi:branched-subunit amino acid ABC-type transport system permease component
VGIGNLLLRVGFALSIVGAAIGLTAFASSSLARCDAATCPPVASVAPAVAGYQAAPLTTDRQASSPSSTSSQQAATLVALATSVVLVAIFAILFSYRQRPGGVRTPGR